MKKQNCPHLALHIRPQLADDIVVLTDKLTHTEACDVSKYFVTVSDNTSFISR